MNLNGVSLAGYTTATLNFKYWLNTESTYDFFYVNIRDQNGTWHAPEFKVSGNQSSLGWQSKAVNLNAYAGQTGLYIQFLFTSDGATINPSPSGVWVDEVSLVASASGTIRVTVNSSSGSTLSTSEMNAVILFASTGSEVARKQPPTSNPMDFTSVNYGGYFVDVYCWDMLAAGISFTHNSSLSTITLPANPKRPLTATAYYSDGTTRLPGATVYLDSWNGQSSSWTQRASATTDSSGMASFSAWPTTQTGEKYRIRVNNGGGQVGLRDPASVANTTSGSSYSINTSVAPPIQYGNISAGLKKVNGTDAPVSAGTPRFKLYTSPNQILSGANPATFSNIPVGTYLLEGFQTGTFWGEEFWNSQQVTVAAGATTNAVLIRKYPYATSVVMKNVETDATISPGQIIPAGLKVRFEVTVRNDLPGTSLNTRVHFVADLGRNTPYDYDWGTSAAQTITGSGGTATFSFTTAFDAHQTGQFYYALEVVTDVEGNPVRTDSWTWTQACATELKSKLTGMVPSPNFIEFGYAPTPVFLQRYPAGTTAGITPNVRTWVIIHGRQGSSTDQWVTDLARAIAGMDAYKNDQILLLDWKNAADSFGPSTTEEDWIKPVAFWAAGKLVDYGFAGSDLNLIGHSWGGNMTAEIAELIPYSGPTVNKVNSIIALDPARNGVGFDYDPDDLTADNGARETDFARNSRFSWAFHSSDLGSGGTPPTAHETFAVDTGGTAGDRHTWVHDVFIDMLINPNQVSQRFTLARLLDQSVGSRTLGPWDPDRYEYSFGPDPLVGGYEALLTTTVGGQSPYSLTYYSKTTGQEVTEYALVDITPPTVTINQTSGQSDPTGNSPINFTVVFSEAVIGFGNNSSDITLGGTAGATGKSVTGSGTTYNVAVSGMTQSGTVTATIPAGAAQDSAGKPSLASTSSDNLVNYIAPHGTLQFASSTYSVNENGGSVQIYVSRTGGSYGAASVSYGTANGTATAGSDYTAASGTLSWADGDTASKPITVPIANDSTPESSESFTVTLSNPTGGAMLGSPVTATVTISDDDPPPPGTLQFAQANYSVNENAGTVTLSVTRASGSSGAVSVQYATANGSAVAPGDFTTTSGTLNWASGDTASKSITVPIANDGTPESGESFIVTLSNPAGGATLGSPATATVTIVDDDPPPSGTLQLAQANYSVNENAGTVTLSATRTGGSSGAVSVQYATANGSAVAPGDYAATSGTLNWASGDTASKTITVPIVNDSTAESSESFTVTLSNPAGGATLGSPPAATVTILGDDSLRQLTGMSLSNGVFRFVLNGPVGSTYVIQVSSNLVNWLPLVTNVIPASGSVPITDPVIGPATRFYRAVGGNTSVAPNNMALILADSFTMGDNLGDGVAGGWPDEVPLHTVYVSAFYMDQYEVTKALWDDVYNWAITHGYSFDNGGLGKAATHPVQTVSWFDCVKWCNARSEKENKTPAYYTDAGLSVRYRTGQVAPYVNWSSGYRLPTEAEWEKAARGGASGHRFPWADADTISWSRANYYAYPLSAGGYDPLSAGGYAYDINPTTGYNPNFQSGGSPYTSPVGNFAANGYGLYDLAGNVWEWCWDWYGDYSSVSQTDPRGPALGSSRVLRGGSWDSFAFRCRSAFRYYGGPSGSYLGIGFRSVLPPGQ
jgi:formylglycine-generating enzyme required for sulfatase activity